MQEVWASVYMRQMVGKDTTKGIDVEVLTALNSLEFPCKAGTNWEFSKSKPGEHRWM